MIRDESLKQMIDYSQGQKEAAYMVLGNIVNLLNALNDATVSFLLISKYSYTAMAPSIMRGITYIVGAVALYYTGKQDPVRMMWSLVINDVSIFVLDVGIFIVPFKKLLTWHRKGEEV